MLPGPSGLLLDQKKKIGACTFTLPQHTDWLCFLANGVADSAGSCSVARLAGSAFPATSRSVSLAPSPTLLHAFASVLWILSPTSLSSSVVVYATSFTHVCGDHALCRPSFPNAASLYTLSEACSQLMFRRHSIVSSGWAASRFIRISLGKSSPEIELRRSQAHCWVELFSLLGARFLCWTALWIRRPLQGFLATVR
jgi:hypothetical protein